MKKLSILILIIALAWSCYIGYTAAYFTDEVTSSNNVIASGNIQIIQYEQERVKDSNGDFTAELKKYTQNQQLTPMVAGSDNRTEVQVGDYKVKLRDSSAKNYVDKLVTVKNVGSNPAYLRTFIALPTGGYDGSSPSDSWISCDVVEGSHWNWKKSGGSWNKIDNVTIDGSEYDIYIGTYDEPLAPGKTTVPSMLGFYLNAAVDGSVDLKGDEKIELLVTTQAVQTTTFNDSSKDALTNAKNALDTVFGEAKADNNPWVNDKTVSVADDAALQNALSDSGIKGKTIRLADNKNYNLPEQLPSAISIIGHGEDTVITAPANGFKGTAIEFFNVKFANSVSFTGSGEFDTVIFGGKFKATFNNSAYITECVFESQPDLSVTDNAVRKDVIVENCTKANGEAITVK